MPNKEFTATKGFSCPLSETIDSTGAVVAAPEFTADALTVQVNAPGFVTAGGATIPGPSFTATGNGVATITGKGADDAGDAVVGAITITVVTIESGTIAVGAGVA